MTTDTLFATAEPKDLHATRTDDAARGRINASNSAVKNILLVHGAFVDGSGWANVYKLLREDGYKVTVVQNPTNSLVEDVAATKRAIALADGEVILVGHSYGGVVITEAGTDPKVAGLVFIAAFAPDRGESVAKLIENPVPGFAPPPFLPPRNGVLSLDPAKFPAAFAADVEPEAAEFMANSQIPWGDGAVNGAVTDPAWTHKPSWYLVAADDLMIPPPAQRQMAQRSGAETRESPGSHAIYVSNPLVVAAIIEAAASGSEVPISR